MLTLDIVLECAVRGHPATRKAVSEYAAMRASELETFATHAKTVEQKTQMTQRAKEWRKFATSFAPPDNSASG